MAKKVLTPEEFQAKLEKKAAKRKLFFGTFTKALAFFLAIAIAWSLAAIAFTPAIGGGTVVSGGNQTQQSNTSTPGDSTSTPGDSTPGDSTSTPGDTNTPSTPGDTNTPNGSTGVTAADAAKALNDATAKAAKATYKWTRSGKFTKDVNVGVLTSVLNGLISGVVKNNDYPGDDHYTVNEVVGGFLGIKDLSGTFTNGKCADLNDNDSNKYKLKAMTLTANDIANVSVSGNTYTITIKDTNTPDANSAWAHASNDYITVDEVNKEIAKAVSDKVKVQKDGTSANYKNIKLIAVIENGKLTSLKYSYDMEATLAIKAGLTANGTGAAHMEASYSDFKY